METASRKTALPCKAKMQYLLTLQVSRCLLLCRAEQLRQDSTMFNHQQTAAFSQTASFIIHYSSPVHISHRPLLMRTRDHQSSLRLCVYTMHVPCFIYLSSCGLPVSEIELRFLSVTKQLDEEWQGVQFQIAECMSHRIFGSTLTHSAWKGCILHLIIS